MTSGDVPSRIESCVLSDPGRRGIAHLFLPGQIEAAARSLQRAKHVVIATGFFIPEADSIETDGPPGAIELAEGLRTLGIGVGFLTDAVCAPVLEQAGLSPIDIHGPSMALPAGVTHLVSIERLGRSLDGRYHNMRGQDVTPFTGDVDRHFLDAPARGIATIGIGDGGNEIGMGNARDKVVQHIVHGSLIASIVPTDALIVAGTSNWGAWALLAMLTVQTGRRLLPTIGQSRNTLKRCVDAGAVDAISKTPRLVVDGLADADYFRPLTQLHVVVGESK